MPNWHLLLILQQVLILQVLFPDPSFWGQWMGSSTGNSTKYYYYITLAHPGSALTSHPDVEPCWARQIEIYFCPSVIHKRRRECWFFCLPCPAQLSPATQHPSRWETLCQRLSHPGRLYLAESAINCLFCLAHPPWTCLLTWLSHSTRFTRWRLFWQNWRLRAHSEVPYHQLD
jgi:hypothetical protein